MAHMKLFLFAVICLWLRQAESSQTVIKNMSENFGKALDTCKKELNLSDAIMTDFYNYWKEDFKITNRETGCAIACLATKIDMFDPDGKLHHGNAKDYAMEHGADEQTATTLVTIMHECEKAAGDNSDNCLKVVDIANCFKVKVHELKWAPNMDVAIAEVISEV